MIYLKRNIEWNSRPRKGRGAYRWRDARSEGRRGWQYGYTSSTDMSWTPWLLLNLMRHAGPLEGTERQAPWHISVRQGSGLEEAEAELRENLKRASKAYAELLENVTLFQYLGRVLTAGDNDWLTVVDKLGKARKSWGRLSQILRWEGTDPKVSGHFY